MTRNHLARIAAVTALLFGAAHSMAAPDAANVNDAGHAAIAKAVLGSLGISQASS